MSRYSQQKINKSRLAIENSASELFRQKGYHGVGLAEITEKAGLTNGTFYSHFGSKKDLFITIIQRAIENRDKIFSTFSSLQPKSAAKELINWYLREEHLLIVKKGCLMPRLAGDLSEYSNDSKGLVEKYLFSYIEFFERLGLSNSFSSFIVSSAIGTLTCARILDKAKAKHFLNTSKLELQKIIEDYFDKV